MVYKLNCYFWICVITNSYDNNMFCVLDCYFSLKIYSYTWFVAWLGKIIFNRFFLAVLIQRIKKHYVHDKSLIIPSDFT